MVIMALDHVRDYFHAPAFMFDPTDPAVTTVPIFFTRWITHFCAPLFSFLAGLSAFFVGRRKEKKELSAFLLRRGLWLIFIEFTFVNFAWYFDIGFKTPGLLVIWVLGISMITLSALVYLPIRTILIFSCILIVGHNLLDPVHFEGNVAWAILHDQRIFMLSDHYKLYVFYPMLPWIAVMSLGYCFGEFYTPSFEPARRKKILNTLGLSAIAIFVVLRVIDVYGDSAHWKLYPTAVQTAMSMLATTKYPPSLCYLLMTLGPALLFLANTENLKGKVVAFFSLYGRVPFFYYILHIYLIHLFAMTAAEFTGFGWKSMILSDWVGFVPQLKGYGFNLGIVYLIWIAVVLLLYPLCKKFDVYKLNHKEKWWLSYL